MAGGGGYRADDEYDEILVERESRIVQNKGSLVLELQQRSIEFNSTIYELAADKIYAMCYDLGGFFLKNGGWFPISAMNDDIILELEFQSVKKIFTMLQGLDGARLEKELGLMQLVTLL
ncbi:hypothetical protein ACFE04_027436 [Oxalis oulophora]